MKQSVIDTATEGLKDIGEHLKTDPIPPFYRELRRYDTSKLRADLTAGATVAMVTIPQSVGFALLAGIPVEAALTCAIVGGLFCALFTTSRHLVFGPTNTISIIVASALATLYGTDLTALQKVLVIGSLIGFIQIGAGFLKLGNLTQFVSRTVILAYGAGVAVLIVAGQVGNLLGVGQPDQHDLLSVVQQLMEKFLLLEVNLYTAGVGLGSLALLLTLQRLKPNWPTSLLVMLVGGGAALVFGLDKFGVPLVRDSGAVAGTMPLFTGFPLSGQGAKLVPQVFSAALAAAILGMLEAITITKTMATRSGQRIDPNRELMAMGAGNLAATTFGAMPGSASFVRSALNMNSGARTQMAAIFSSGLLLVLVLAVARFTNFIPTAVIAAMLIVLAWHLVDWRRIGIARTATGADNVVFWVTFMATLFLKLDTAIFAGVGISLVAFLRKASMPTLSEYTFNDTGHLAAMGEESRRPNTQISIIHVEGELFFGAADIFQSQVLQMAENDDIKVFILRLKNARHLDATTVMALLELRESLEGQGRYLLVSGMSRDVARVLRNSGAMLKLGENNVFPTEANPTISTKRAMERAIELLQTKHPGVRLFYDRPQA